MKIDQRFSTTNYIHVNLTAYQSINIKYIKKLILPFRKWQTTNKTPKYQWVYRTTDKFKTLSYPFLKLYYTSAQHEGQILFILYERKGQFIDVQEYILFTNLTFTSESGKFYNQFKQNNRETNL